MRILAIDPGPVESAYVEYFDDGRGIYSSGIQPNQAMQDWIPASAADHLVVEMIASYGLPVGAEVFETCCFIGRFEAVWDECWESTTRHRLFRRDVKLHLCGSARAKDSNVRQALLDKWGGKTKAIGNKKQPGPLYGVSKDVWSALAVAVTWVETRKDGQ